jgi:hypothetical protein
MPHHVAPPRTTPVAIPRAAQPSCSDQSALGLSARILAVSRSQRSRPVGEAMLRILVY